MDYHIRGFSQMGADVVIEHGFMKATCERLQGTQIYINRSSVGTTVNLMIAASLGEGVTTLENAAKEPEVVDLAIFLNGMGAKIRGAGTDVIRIEGVSSLRGIEYSIIPDRIEAGTFMCAASITGGDVLLKNVVPEHLRAPIIKLEEAGVIIEKGANELRVIAPGRLLPVEVETTPYPGFPTDLQQPFLACMAVADGTSVIRETIFDRFRYVDELRRMGADIKTERETAIIAVSKLTGAPVEITDLRAGAALALRPWRQKGQRNFTVLRCWTGAMKALRLNCGASVPGWSGKRHWKGSTSSRQSLLYKHNGGAYMAPFSLLAPSEAFWAVRLTVTVSEIIR